MKDERFQRYLTAARRGRPEVEPSMPYGFATRVAALWAARSRREDPWSLWERLARYGALVVAALVLALALAPAPRSAEEPDYLLRLAQPVLEEGRLF